MFERIFNQERHAAPTMSQAREVPGGEHAQSALSQEEVKAILQSTGEAAAFGEILAVLMRSEQHLGLTLDQIRKTVLPPFALKQYVVAKAQPDNHASAPIAVGVAFWAYVSDELDQQMATGQLLAPLQPTDWKGGSNLWLIQVVAPGDIPQAIIEDLRHTLFAGGQAKVVAPDETGQPRLEVIQGAPAQA